MSQITTISLAQRPMLPQQLPRRTRFVYPKGGTEALPFKEDLFHFDAVDIDRRQPTQVRIELRNFISSILFQCGTWTYKSNYAGERVKVAGSASLSAKRPDRGRSGPQRDREPILREIHPLSTKQKRNPRVASRTERPQFRCQSRLARTHATPARLVSLALSLRLLFYFSSQPPSSRYGRGDSRRGEIYSAVSASTGEGLRSRELTTTRLTSTAVRNELTIQRLDAAGVPLAFPN
ncbi:hypothetical protein CDAR_561841 [Caerostris darwini]|uniref:Uncharacterized protein n=1 Tax=Caerostris darwini TaxID=1538125 RepID=A0AAV4PEA4_9ARAC|nr:hypothetical protein CDAR_561841 [Caerostris darwini]